MDTLAMMLAGTSVSRDARSLNVGGTTVSVSCQFCVLLCDFPGGPSGSLRVSDAGLNGPVVLCSMDFPRFHCNTWGVVGFFRDGEFSVSLNIFSLWTI